jgi:hypothetical protein
MSTGRARNAADLQLRSTATDWHDGQISRSRENAVKEIFIVIACDKRGAFAQGSNATSNPVCPAKKTLDYFASLAMTERGSAFTRPDGS